MWLTFDHLAEITPDLASKVDSDKRLGYLFSVTSEGILVSILEEDLIEQMRVERYDLGGGYTLPPDQDSSSKTYIEFKL